jgi:hypothetical protein
MYVRADETRQKFETVKRSSTEKKRGALLPLQEFLKQGEMNDVEQNFSLNFKGCRIHDFTSIQSLTVLKVTRN